MQVDFSSNYSNLEVLLFCLTVYRLLLFEFYGLIRFVYVGIHYVNGSDRCYIFY